MSWRILRGLPVAWSTGTMVQPLDMAVAERVVPAWKLAEAEAERDGLAKSAVELAELLRAARRRHEVLERERDAAVADRDRARRMSVNLREELSAAATVDGQPWRDKWEQDRRNLVLLERRLAVLEGREQPAVSS